MQSDSDRQSAYTYDAELLNRAKAQRRLVVAAQVLRTSHGLLLSSSHSKDGHQQRVTDTNSPAKSTGSRLASLDMSSLPTSLPLAPLRLHNVIARSYDAGDSSGLLHARNAPFDLANATLDRPASNQMNAVHETLLHIIMSDPFCPG